MANVEWSARAMRHPHSFGNLAHDHGYRGATLSLLLRVPLTHQDTYLGVTDRAMVRPTYQYEAKPQS